MYRTALQYAVPVRRGGPRGPGIVRDPEQMNRRLAIERQPHHGYILTPLTKRYRTKVGHPPSQNYVELLPGIHCTSHRRSRCRQQRAGTDPERTARPPSCTPLRRHMYSGCTRLRSSTHPWNHRCTQGTPVKVNPRKTYQVQQGNQFGRKDEFQALFGSKWRGLTKPFVVAMF